MQPLIQPRITGVFLYHKKVGDPWVRGILVLSDMFECLQHKYTKHLLLVSSYIRSILSISIIGEYEFNFNIKSGRFRSFGWDVVLLGSRFVSKDVLKQ